MSRRVALGLALGLVAATGSAAAEGDRMAESREIVMDFMAELKGELAAALQQGGPVSAIEVCRVGAREIAQGQAEKTGFKVGRTSSKVRNPRNAPDAWEKKVLQGFEQRAAKGADVATLEASEVVDRGGKKVFRYMKAIPTGEPCLVCHGDSLSADLSAKIAEFYPKDRAVGFKVGEVRGAFTLQKVLE